ncbi:hypothetical protein A3L09_09315 [Thermococcus profundus]|uniref:Uncharacterized protein n=1 Tax=Thermococcus profundus TaxID=49899 RepID=A0A2Z2MFI0_THEPR|nr:hypothetical protein [Thermococcus profundus]ASJ03445.1 hypothetical protein A3L09_09315 [Thermococcus profundus]
MRAVGKVAFFDGERALILVRRYRRRGIKREMAGRNPWIPIPRVYIPEELREKVELLHRTGEVFEVEFALKGEVTGAGMKGYYGLGVRFTRDGVEYWVNGYSVKNGVVDVLGIPFRVEEVPEIEWVYARGKKLELSDIPQDLKNGEDT